MLWPFALKAAEQHHSRFNVDEEDVSLEEKFANVWAVYNIADKHTWSCPIYVLDHRLQSGLGGVPK
eukprot:12033565-Ditylum_brightwellii.AAC.1